MAKDPAFLFYPSDWIGGTLGMTFEEKGAYTELLMLQFNRGHMTKHMMGQVVGQLLDKVVDKFTKDEKGLYYNKRLELEINKRKSFVTSRKNNKLGINQYTKKGGHTTYHMENENINIDTIINKEEKCEKKTFNTKPVSSDFNGLPENYIINSIELVRITAQSDIDEKIVLGMWNIFKTQKLTGSEYYANEGKVYSHFVDWIKKQKFQNGHNTGLPNGGNSKQGTSTARTNALKKW